MFMTRSTGNGGTKLMFPTSTESRAAAAADGKASKVKNLLTKFGSQYEGSVNVVSTSTESRGRESQDIK
eukprot:11896241-Karenia_brevis.AAC.1